MPSTGAGEEPDRRSLSVGSCRPGSGSSHGHAVPGESDQLAAAFLSNHPETVATIEGWARGVVVHQVWEFDSPEDIVQETLLALVENLRTERFAGGNLRAYVRRITKNICISQLRRKRSRGTQIPTSDELPAVRGGGGEADRLEDRTLVRQILENLEEACRKLVAQVYFQGLSRREIAEGLGISEDATNMRLYRCLEKVRAAQGVVSGRKRDR